MERNYEKVKSIDWHVVKIPPMINWIIISLVFTSIVIGQQYTSFLEFTDLIKHMPLLGLMFPVLIVGYVIVHELIHGVFMKFYSGTSPKYAFNGPFIFAKSDAYFSKSSYITLTLAPFIILGIGAILLGFFIPIEGVWFAIFIGSINLYASRGDLHAAILLINLPKELVIKDDGDSIDINKFID